MARTPTKKKTEVTSEPEEIKEPTAPQFVDTVTDEDDDVEFSAETPETEDGKERYFESVGRRKESIARVRMMTRKSGDEARPDAALILVNEKDYLDYFQDTGLHTRIEQPLRRLKSLARFKVTARVSGGGASGQADAIRHGISRTLEMFDPNFRKKLKKAGFLTRDPRVKERKKPGLKKARKSPRWSKR